MLTIGEVARTLKVSRATVYRMATEGRLPAIRLNGSLLRIRRGDLDAVLAALREVDR